MFDMLCFDAQFWLLFTLMARAVSLLGDLVTLIFRTYNLILNWDCFVYF